MNYSFTPQGVCSKGISFDINNDIVSNVKFEKGCNGNLQAIAKLVDGKSVDYIVRYLQGIKCGNKETSCCDQLTKAITEAINIKKGEKSIMKLYTTHCPKCMVLESKLKDKGIEYEEITDVDVMLEKGFQQAPVLEVDGEIMDFPTANKYINSLIGSNEQVDDGECESCKL